ncbi:MAG: CaiB/BaiF CoA-transferase family protein [Pseudomonadota bacterium]
MSPRRGGGTGLGPLSGVKTVEFAGLGPGPFCGMILADLGADVVLIERPGARDLLGQERDLLQRGKRKVTLDLKSDDGAATALDLVASADLLIEGFRPGVMERLGLGPDACHARNPRLVYGRMTGWGQEGPRAETAGHDINYIALAGALHGIGAEAPVPPLNLLGDFGGGALYLAVGLLAGLHHARATGQGQVVDAAIVDGTAHLMTMIHSLAAAGVWQDRRASNVLDGAAHFYRNYACADGKYIAVGSIEPQFYAALLKGAGVAAGEFSDQADPARWPALAERLAEVFATRPRSAWLEIFDGTDACVAPVLSMAESVADPHLTARGTYTEVEGITQPSPAPRFSRTPGAAGGAPRTVAPGDILKAWSARE